VTFLGQFFQHYSVKLFFPIAKKVSRVRLSRLTASSAGLFARSIWSDCISASFVLSYPGELTIPMYSAQLIPDKIWTRKWSNASSVDRRKWSRAFDLVQSDHRVAYAT
jgi:hypothetical protein